MFCITLEFIKITFALHWSLLAITLTFINSEPGELKGTGDGSLLSETKLLNYKIILLGEPGEPN